MDAHGRQPADVSFNTHADLAEQEDVQAFHRPRCGASKWVVPIARRRSQDPSRLLALSPHVYTHRVAISKPPPHCMPTTVRLRFRWKGLSRLAARAAGRRMRLHTRTSSSGRFPDPRAAQGFPPHPPLRGSLPPPTAPKSIATARALLNVAPACLPNPPKAARMLRPDTPRVAGLAHAPAVALAWNRHRGIRARLRAEVAADNRAGIDTS